MTQDMNHMKEQDWTPERCSRHNGETLGPGSRCHQLSEYCMEIGCHNYARGGQMVWDLLAADRQKLAEADECCVWWKDKLTVAERERDALRGKVTELEQNEAHSMQTVMELQAKLSELDGEKTRLIEALANEQERTSDLRKKWEAEQKESNYLEKRLDERAYREADLMRQLAAKDDADPQPCTDCAERIEGLEKELVASRETSRDYAGQRDKAEADLTREQRYSQEIVDRLGVASAKLQRLRKDRNRWRSVVEMAVRVTGRKP